MLDAQDARWWGWFTLAGCAVVGASLLLLVDHARSWHYLADAARLLFAGPSTEGSGLELYRSRPDFQFGPVSIILAAAFTALPGGIEEWTVMVVASLAGVLTLALVADAVGPGAAAPLEAGDERTWHRVLLLTGLAFLVPWLRLAAYTAHVDDVIVLTAAAAAVAGVARDRPGWTTAAVAVAVAAKPWAIILVPLCLVGDDPRRWWRAALAIAPAALSWGVFILGSPGTLGSLRGFVIAIDPNSGLRALGVAEPTTPGWLRPTQLALGLAVTTVVALRRDAWPRILAAGIAARLLIDPATNHYYTTGLVVGALVWELHREPGRLPWRTAVGAVVLELAARDVSLGGAMPTVRFLLLAAVIVAAIATPVEATQRVHHPPRAVRPRPRRGHGTMTA